MIELGVVAWTKGDATLAIERWQRAHEWAPDQMLTQFNLGRALLVAGRRPRRFRI